MGFPRQWRPGAAIRLSVTLHVLAVPALALAPGWWVWIVGLIGLNHLALGVLGMMPRSSGLGRNLVRLPQAGARREVALTFDDGPDPEVTPRVLDLLDRFGAKASFFCIGERVLEHPGLARDIARRGHSVENHSHRHLYAFACYSPSALRAEIDRASEAIKAANGEAPQFFRAPMGLRSPLLDPVLARTGHLFVSWARNGRDGLSRDPARVLARLLRGLEAGDILLLHDGSCAQTRDGEPVVLVVLPQLLEELAARGLKAVSLRTAFSPADARLRGSPARWSPAPGGR